MYHSPPIREIKVFSFFWQVFCQGELFLLQIKRGHSISLYYFPSALARSWVQVGRSDASNLEGKTSKQITLNCAAQRRCLEEKNSDLKYDPWALNHFHFILPNEAGVKNVDLIRVRWKPYRSGTPTALLSRHPLLPPSELRPGCEPCK